MSGTTFNTPLQQQRLAMVYALVARPSGATQTEVAGLIGVGRTTALPFLHRLRDDGQVHRRPRSKLWVAGPSAGWIADDQAGGRPAQLVASYAERNTGRVQRDYLVEALFGPARPGEAANAASSRVRA